MGGPSSKEIQSDETLTKYIDGEITDALLLELFERQLSTDVDLQKRLQAQIAIKSQISSISGGARLRPTERVKLEIHNLVKNATKTETPPTIDDDGGQTISDAEMLIVKLIDDELNDNELRMVETLISQNDTYRELYEQLVTSKIHTSEYLFSEDVEPSNKVKMDIKSMVSDTLTSSGENGIAASEAPPGDLSEYSYEPMPKWSVADSRLRTMRPLSEPTIVDTSLTRRARKSRTGRLSSSLGYYTQRLIPLAAVFVVGLYISPTLFSSGTKTVPGVDLTLRGADTQINLGEGLDFISVINEPPAALSNSLYTPSRCNAVC